MSTTLGNHKTPVDFIIFIIITKFQAWKKIDSHNSLLDFFKIIKGKYFIIQTILSRSWNNDFLKAIQEIYELPHSWVKTSFLSGLIHLSQRDV